MSQSRHEVKVGIFVLVCLVLMGFLMLNFSKGLSLFKPTYTLKLRATNVGGIRSQAGVLMSGVPIGAVIDIQLAADGKSVMILAKIRKEIEIRSDAEFIIESAGFLGDQFVAVRPTKNEGKVLRDGDEVTCREPFSLSEVAQASVGFIQRLDQTVTRLDGAIKRVDTVVLDPVTLTNLAMTFANFRQVSDKALVAVGNINHLVVTNSDSISTTLTNLARFSAQLNVIGEDLNGMVATNRTEISVAVKNLQEATLSMRKVLEDVQGGKGVVGGLLQDDGMKTEVSQVVHNFAVLSSNLNRFGLLYKPKQPKKTSEVTPYGGKR